MAAVTASTARASGLDMCGFVRTALAHRADNFARMLATTPDGRTTAYPLQPSFIASGANCYASNHDPTQWYVACLWTLDVATASAADDEVRSATHRLSACLGPGYLERPSLPGGFLFFEKPTEDEAIVTEAVVGRRYKLIVQVLGPGIQLQ